MSVTPSPIGGFAAQFFDNNGVILSGGKIFTYAAGTTAPQASYTSASGTTPHSNPIILDSAGRVPGGEIWLTDGLVYKFVIETATAILLGTYDNITGVNSNFVNYTIQEEVITATAGQTVFNLSTINYTPGTNSLSVYIDGVNQYVGDSYLETDGNTVTFTSGVHVGGEVKFTTAIQTTTGAVDASIVSYEPPFVDSVGTNVEDKLAQYISVKDFGAVGDGVTDDTAALQNALDAVSGTGMSLLIPPSTSFYRITSTLYPKSNTTIFGYGAEIKNSGTAIFNMIWALGTDGGPYLTDISVFGLTVDCNGTYLDAGGSGIGASFCDNFRVKDCTVKNAWLQGIFFARGGRNCWISDNYVERAWGDGIHIGDQFTGNTLENVWITDNDVFNCFDDGIGVTGGAHLVWITGNNVDTVTAAAGIDLSGCYQTYVQGNYVTNYGQIGIRVQRFNASQCFDIEIIDNVVDGPPANQAAINLFGPNNTNVNTFASNPLTVRGNRIKNVTNTGSYGIFVTGAGMVTIEDNFIEGNKQGIVLSGLPATSTVGPIVNCKIKNNRFVGLTDAIGLSSGNNGFVTAGNQFISCTNIIAPNSLAYWVQPTVWEADYKFDDTFFKGVTYTTTGTTQTEVAASTRIKVSRGQRVQLNYFAQDISGSGLGDSTIQLYDVTNAAVLATATITGNTSPYAWRTLDVALIATDAEVTVRYGRTFAGGSLSIQGAYARIG